MTDVDGELGRLFDATRIGTEPEAGDAARIRVSLGSRLARAAAVGAVAGAGAALTGASAATGAGVKVAAAKPLLGANRLLLLKIAGGALLVGAAMAVTVGVARGPSVTPPHANATPIVPTPASIEPMALPVPTTLAVETVSSSRPSGSASGGSAMAASSAAVIHVRAQATAPATVPTDPGTALARELRLVQSMQSALASRSDAEALRLADEHARTFPRGTLAEERESVRAIVRCHGSEDARKEALQSFEARYPRSPQGARVHAACKP
jgi:hypothetical protein